jgi:hypothetical protein
VHRCLRNARRRLAAGQRGVSVAPRALPPATVCGVEAVLRRIRATCLEAALLRQQWLRSQGVMNDVVVGVKAPFDGFMAHAWLDNPREPTPPQPWHELTRLGAGTSGDRLGATPLRRPRRK